MVIQHIFT